MKSIEQAVESAIQWMDVDGIVGVSQSEIDGKDCILVLVSTKTPEVLKAIPPEYEGYTVIIKDTDTISAEN